MKLGPEIIFDASFGVGEALASSEKSADELGQLGTQLTISQLFSVLTMLFGIGLWAYTSIRKQPLAYPSKHSLELAEASDT